MQKFADRCRVYPGTHGKFEVDLDDNSYEIDLPKKTCTCCKWQISGIPCEHAYGAIMDSSLNVEDYISRFFSTSFWCKTYETATSPQRGPRVWMNSGLPLITAPPEPELPGRKKKPKKFPRVKGKLESPKKKNAEKLGRKGVVMHCSYCREAGHNVATCNTKKRRLDEQDGTSSGDAFVCTQQSSNAIF